MRRRAVAALACIVLGSALTASQGQARPPVSLPVLEDTVSRAGADTVRAPVGTDGPDRLLLALVSADGPARPATVSGAGLSWWLVGRHADQPGTAEIWAARAPRQLAGADITAVVPSGKGVHHGVALSVLSVRNGLVGATQGRSGRTGTPTVTLTPKATGSLVYGVGFDPDAAQARTLPSDQAMRFQHLDRSANTHWMQARRSRTLEGRPTTVRVAAPANHRWNLQAVEVMPWSAPSDPPPTNRPTTTTLPSSTTIPGGSTTTLPPAATTTTTAGGHPGPTTTTAPPSGPTTTVHTGTTLGSTTTTTAAAPGGVDVKVSGNRLVDANGKTLVLRGANLSGTEFVCAQGWSDDAYGGQPLAEPATFTAMKAWKINVVRIPLNEDCWLGINGVRIGGTAYQQAIATEVAAAHSAGMIVILDLHWTAPGTQTALSQNPLPDAEHAIPFWRQVAAAYKDADGIIFDLFNEPYDYWSTSGDPWSDWLDGGTMTKYVTGGSPYTVDAEWQSAGMQDLVDAVRGAGARQPILVNGLDWANDVSGWLSHAPSDPAKQLIAGAHIYPGQPNSDAGAWNAVFPAIQAQYPVLIGESGDSVRSPVSSFFPAFLEHADGHGWSYLAWTWNAWGNADNVLIKDWDGTPTDGMGKVFRDHLATVG